jgi:hypothetical protein
MVEIINALNHLTWPGAIGLVAVCGLLGFYFYRLMKYWSD